MEVKSTREAAASHGLKILIYGGPGSGKTRLSATTSDPDATLILSAEAGLISLVDHDIDYVEILRLDDLRRAYTWLAENQSQPKYKHIVLDSLSEIAEVILANEKAESRDPRKAYGEMADRVMTLCKQFRNLLSYNVYFLTKIERGQDENGTTIFQPSLPGRKLGPGLPYIFDEVFALRVGKNEEGEIVRYFQCHNDGTYDAKDRSGALKRS